MGFCNCSMFWCALLCVHYSFRNHLNGEERAGCFASFVFLVSSDLCVALPYDDMGLSTVCDCRSYLLTIFATQRPVFSMTI